MALAEVRTDLIVDGQWVPPTGDGTMEIRNPANPDEVVGQAAAASQADTVRAIEAAHAAYPAWAALSYQDRAGFLGKMVDAVQDGVEERIPRFVREHGKIKREAGIELTRLGARFEYTASLADRLARDEELDGPPFRTTITRQPRGVASLIIPWNWPLSILGAKLPQALLAGNTVVVKPAETSPLVTMQTLKLMADALPPGVLNAVTGSVDDVGKPLIEHPLVRKIDFTGGTETGKKIMAAAAPTLKDLTLELGGNDPAIVLDDAVIDEDAVRKMVLGSFMTSGQICMAIKRLYVHDRLYDHVLEALRAALQRFVVGNGLDDRTTMGPLNNRRQRDWVVSLVSEARGRGAHVDELGEPLDSDELARGWFCLPTLVTGVDNSYQVVSQEQFGPVLPIIPFQTVDEAVAMANDSEYGLCSSVWSADVERAIAVGRRIEAGYTYINNHGPMAQDNRAPFGGMKHSGIGRQLGYEGVLEFLEPHSISVSVDAG
jgi:acyl-CoA reductase-like NAD-dependent aldehyde dehydrogenase